MRDLMAVLAGPANARLGEDVARLLEMPAVDYACEHFPDGEMQVDLRESVRGRDVYIVQPTGPPVDRHLVQLLLLADACRRAGTARLTGVIPYFGYARQDRRTDRRSLGARVAADILGAGHFDRFMVTDAHTAALEGFCSVPVDHLTAVPLLAEAAARHLPQDVVVVAPDFGAVKLAREYARLFVAPTAFVHKTRISGAAVEAQNVIGEVRGLTPVIVDDMLSTGATVKAAIGALDRAGARLPAVVVVTHALLIGPARDLLGRLPITRLIAGDTVPVENAGDLPMEVTSVAPLLAAAIRRNHYDESLADLRGHR